MKETYKSRVYTDRPAYADFDTPAKFQAIQSIVAKHLTQHPKAICSYSGGADSDILIDLIERTREIFNLPPVKYAFFNTGLEMQATKDHVKETAEKYGVEIQTYRPKVNIVMAARTYGIPFVSKIMSAGLSEWQKKGVPLSVAEEYENAKDKAAKRRELKERYPKCESLLNFLCCCNSAGEPRPNIQLVINSSKYMRDFIDECPPGLPDQRQVLRLLQEAAGPQCPEGLRHDYNRGTPGRGRYAVRPQKGQHRTVLHRNQQWAVSSQTAVLCHRC